MLRRGENRVLFVGAFAPAQGGVKKKKHDWGEKKKGKRNYVGWEKNSVGGGKGGEGMSFSLPSGCTSARAKEKKNAKKKEPS